MAKQRVAGPAAPPDRPEDFEKAFRALREVLMDVVDGKNDADELRVALRDVCASAHRNGMKAEDLLIRFKAVWADLPQLAGLPRGRQRNEVLARVASLCIEEFYSGAPASSPRAPAPDHSPHGS